MSRYQQGFQAGLKTKIVQDKIDTQLEWGRGYNTGRADGINETTLAIAHRREAVAYVQGLVNQGILAFRLDDDPTVFLKACDTVHEWLTQSGKDTT